MEDARAKKEYIFSVTVWAFVGLFRHYCHISSSWLSAGRAFLGVFTLLLILLLKRQSVNLPVIRKNALILFCSGASLGLNWIFMFQSLLLIPVSIMTILYNLAPVFVLLASPIVFKERLELKKVCCIFVAVIGMILTTGIVGSDGFSIFITLPNGNRILDKGAVTGMICALIAACFYAGVIILNKSAKDIKGNERCIAQLTSAGLVTLLYSLIFTKFEPSEYDLLSVAMLLVIGVFSTGIVYYFYFGCLYKVSSQTIALWSYMNPVMGVIIGVVFLNEKLTIWVILGGLLVLGSTLIAENPFKKAPSK